MAMSTEAQPATLPLPGGRDGATVRLHPLLAGELRAPPGFLERPAGRLAAARMFVGSRSSWIWCPIPAFLVEHPGAGPILVDTGLHPSVAVDPARNFDRIWKQLLTFRFSPEQGLREQLLARGIGHHDIGVVVMTHLHYDHASGVSEFPDARFVVSRSEWDAAAHGPARRNGYVRSQFDYPFDWRTIDYDEAGVDSYETFGRAVDLFGDGSVRLLSTPGHTAGHQSVLLRLADREALLTADAAYLERTITDDAAPLIVQDRHRFVRSLGEIRRWVGQAPDALVITGHDREQWPRLEPVYE
jgi:glyoxylase-like metal-dependent hydrolase (beta-lactamase superfamily II)